MIDVGIGWRHPHYRELLERASAPAGLPLNPGVDFIEVHSENFFGQGGAALAVLREARSHWPVSLHGVGLGLGSATGVDAWHLDQLSRLVDLIEPVRVSDHACFARGSVGSHDVHAADLLPLPFNRAALDQLAANVSQVQDQLKRSILVENLSAYVSFASSDIPETEFLTELARRTGCQLLVDVNNIYVNALNAQLAGAPGDPLLACCAWLDQIDPQAVGQLHLAGHCAMPDIVIDDHSQVVAEPVWQLFAHAIQRFGPVPALIEWDTDIPPLDVLLGQADAARQRARLGAPAGEPA